MREIACLKTENGEIQQEGTPEEIYAQPANRFVAEFMGSNNRLEASLAEVTGKPARLEGNARSLWGQLRVSKRPGETATALSYVERVQLVDGPGESRLRMDLKSSYYLGERWEYLLELDGLKLRVWGKGPMARGKQWVACRLKDCGFFSSLRVRIGE